MAYERLSSEALEYFPCRYGGSKLLFRGPREDVSGDYIAVLGGSETYGKFVEKPFTRLLADKTEQVVVNLGVMNAGVDIFGSDQAVVELCRKARSTVVQVMGAQNLSNAFYTVHPRRNDRFLKASGALRDLYPEVDFVRFHFTRHLLSSLRDCCPDRFCEIRSELQKTWVRRMKALIGRIGGDVVLLWMAEQKPGALVIDEMESDPIMVEPPMLDELASLVRGRVDVTPSASARDSGLDGKIYSELEAAVAGEMPGPIFHSEVAEALAKALPVPA
ncbi:MAG: hypothetical protein KJN93_08520 [Alphaproteobacteria bacterium]|nr:hypothetical protein [Alphaproteobacteria bacterium]